MLWKPGTIYREEPFENESDLEDAISQVAPVLFGENRIYLDAKRKIGALGKTRNIPDGYLVDLTSTRQPKLYVVENELAAHDPLRHIAVQILEFSLSFEATPDVVKAIVRDALTKNSSVMQQCSDFATKHRFNNVDYLLEEMIFGPNHFNALVVIDELDEELEKVLISRFKFPVEILTLTRFLGPNDERVFKFDPFLSDVTTKGSVQTVTNSVPSTVDPSEIDTIVVPARDEGFNDVFLGENCWHSIRIHSSMIPKIKYVAAYRVAPESAITYIAGVSSIEQWNNTAKYVLNFSAPAQPIGPIRLATNGKVKAPQGPRYTSKVRLDQAKTLDDAF